MNVIFSTTTRLYAAGIGFLAVVSMGLPLVVMKRAGAPGLNHYPFVVQEVSAAASHYITEQAIVSEYRDPRAALVQNGIMLYPEDRTGFIIDTYQAVGGIIKLERAPKIVIIDGKKTREVHSWAHTLSDVLNEKQVPEVGNDDKVSPELASEVTDGTTVTIVRVQETDIIKNETISFQTIEKEDAGLERGKTTVKQGGHTGTKQYTYHVRREDGVEVSRKLTKTEITKPKEDRIVVKGTKLVFGRQMSGSASWYKSRYQAASNVLPRGTRVLVTNIKTGKSKEITIEDHMASNTKVIDLHPDIFTSLGATLADGIQSVVVKEVLN